VPAPPRQVRRTPFALVVVAILGSGLLALLLLNTVLAQDAFVLHDLQRQTAALADREQELQQAVARDEAPSALASRAAALGMVPGGDPLFLRLPDGAVLGNPKAAVGRRAPRPSPSASATPSPQPSPSGTATPAPGARPGGRTRPSAAARPAATQGAR
jgi:hypothetical protein